MYAIIAIVARVARETFPETPEVMSYVYQLWRHTYSTNDVTFPTQLWIVESINQLEQNQNNWNLYFVVSFSINSWYFEHILYK